MPRRGRWAVAPQGRKTSLSILLTTGRQALSDRFPRREGLLTKNFSDRAHLDDFLIRRQIRLKRDGGESDSSKFLQ